jgi:hypothetical protein
MVSCRVSSDLLLPSTIDPKVLKPKILGWSASRPLTRVVCLLSFGSGEKVGVALVHGANSIAENRMTFLSDVATSG